MPNPSHEPLELRPSADTAEPGSPSSEGRPGTLLLLCTAQLMLVLDLTAVNIALPTIIEELDLSALQATWVVTSYVVAFGGLTLLGGRLADARGHRPVLLAGVVVFAAGSAACGFAPSAELLIAGRICQGVGAALVSPAALGSVARLFHGPARIKALGTWAAVGTVGSVGGLIVSGVLTAGPGWRWIFLVNLPLCLLLALVLPRLLPRDGTASGHIDVPGAVLATAAVGALVYGLSRLGQGGATTPALVAFSGAFVLALSLVLVERRHPHPLVPPHVVRQGPVLVGLTLMLVASGFMFGNFFLTTLYLQQVRGLSALATGALFLAPAVAIMLSAHLAGRLITAFGTRVVGTGAFLVVGAGAGVLSRVDVDSSLGLLVAPGLALLAAGLGPAIVIAVSTTMARVPDADAGVVSAVVNIGHEIGGALGLAILAAGLGTALGTSQVAAYADGYTGIAITALAMAALAAWIIPSLRPDPEHLSHGH